MFKLTDGQKDAIRRSMMWYFAGDKREKNIFVLAGSAGTGKSSTASTLVHMLGLLPYQVLYVAPTGKAASVLRSKGCVANTIASTFYHVYRSSNKLSFVKRKKVPDTIKLIVIDEVSMVNGKIMEDILSFGIPVLALGDPGQLPPMYSANPYILNPDVFLQEVMRQGGESGVLILATMARKQLDIPFGVYNESKVIHMNELKDIEKYDMVVCWTNQSRKELNAYIRNKLGYTSPYPMQGEKLMCLKNNYEHLIDKDDMQIMPVNGMGMTALTDAVDDGEFLNLVYSPPFIHKECFSTRVDKSAFDNYLTGEVDGDENENAFSDIPQDVVVLDYGYAGTCHKCQGSEWPNVLVIDEFRGSNDMYSKWLYTAITRASKSVTIART